MKFLLVNNHCLTDFTAGVSKAMFTIARGLVEAGHECRAITTSRFEYAVPFTIQEHLDDLHVNIRWAHQRASRAGKSKPGPKIARYTVDGVPITLLATRHHDESRPDSREAAEYGKLVERTLADYRPDQMIACNGHPMIRKAMAAARNRGITTVFAVRGYGYDERGLFDEVDHVFTCSEFLSRYLQEKIGLPSTPLDSPIQWSEVVAPTRDRKFLTFVNPSPQKGAMWFAKLADTLGKQRPDIPIMVVQSGRSAELLNSIPGIDFTRYPQMVAAPPVPRPAEFFSLTRLLLVPSVWAEPFGRVAAEAMINGIPPLVSDRGGLPDVVGGDYPQGGGRVLPIPEHFTQFTTQLPSEEEIQPWYDAVCALWDDAALYRSVAARAQQIAHQRYSEQVVQAAHVDYLAHLAHEKQALPERFPASN